MIQAGDVIQLVIKAYPDARDELINTVKFWLPKSGTISPHTILSHVSHRVAGNFVADNYAHADELFDLIELFIVDGVDDVSNAARTSFLGNLQNIASNENGFEDTHYVSLLRSKSIDFCKKWDEYTGVKTDGLW